MKILRIAFALVSISGNLFAQQDSLQQQIPVDTTTLSQIDTAAIAPIQSSADSSSPALKVDSLAMSGESQAVVRVDSTRSTTGGLAARLTQAQKTNQWSLSFTRILWAVIFFLAGLVSFKYITRLLELLAERRTNLRLTIKKLIPTIRIIGWTFVLYFIIVVVLAPPIETLVAVTASAGIAIGFASQDILKNIFGGIMILVDRPFQVGDKIEASNYYGEVTQIGLRTVRILTPDDSLVSIPNGEIMNQSVSNANVGESNCQVVAEVYLPPHIDLVKARKLAYRAAAVSRYAYLNKPIAVIFKNEMHQGRSLLKMRLKAYVLDIRYEFPFASEMTEIVIAEFLKHGLVTREELSIVNGYGAPPDGHAGRRAEQSVST